MVRFSLYFVVLRDHDAGRLIGFSHPFLPDGLYLLGDDGFSSISRLPTWGVSRVLRRHSGNFFGACTVHGRCKRPIVSLLLYVHIYIHVNNLEREYRD